MSNEQLKFILKNQIKNFYGLSKIEEKLIDDNMGKAIYRAQRCFKYINSKYHINEINPLHADQYATFLYFLSNCLYNDFGDELNILCNKIFNVIRTTSSVDIFYKTKLPDIFFLAHPLGSVIGGGIFSNYFLFRQNCTVGHNNGFYPKIGEFVSMYPGSMILGNSIIGHNVVLSAGSIVIDEKVPDNCIVFGRSPNLTFKIYEEEEMKKYFTYFKNF